MFRNHMLVYWAEILGLECLDMRNSCCLSFGIDVNCKLLISAEMLSFTYRKQQKNTTLLPSFFFISNQTDLSALSQLQGNGGTGVVFTGLFQHSRCRLTREVEFPAYFSKNCWRRLSSSCGVESSSKDQTHNHLTHTVSPVRPKNSVRGNILVIERLTALRVVPSLYLDAPSFSGRVTRD